MSVLGNLVDSLTKSIQLQNQRREQMFRCQTCTAPYICLQKVVTPVFSEFFGRTYVSEELFCGCAGCVLTVALPDFLPENGALHLKRQLQRRICKIYGLSYTDVVKKNIVCVTCEYVFIRL